MAEVVSNAGPIIALSQIRQLNLLRQLYGNVVIPLAVYTEIKDTVSVAALAVSQWIAVRAVQDALAVELLAGELDKGESEAIVLAQELAGSLLLIDERAATRKARGIGLKTTGTLGVLLEAKQNGFVSEVRFSLEILRRTGFYMDDALYQQVLVNAGED